MLKRYSKHIIASMAAASLQIANATIQDIVGATIHDDQHCMVELVTLGVGQDGGAPHIGRLNDPAWSDAGLALWPTALALIDHRSDKRYLFETTPEITRQLHMLWACPWRQLLVWMQVSVQACTTDVCTVGNRNSESRAAAG